MASIDLLNKDSLMVGSKSIGRINEYPGGTNTSLSLEDDSMDVVHAEYQL
jgi:hypothetical protein